jgi:hypothetical protein
MDADDSPQPPIPIHVQERVLAAMEAGSFSLLADLSDEEKDAAHRWITSIQVYLAVHHDDGRVNDELPLTTVEQAVWATWNALPDDEPAPVKRIAAQLNMATADVAFIVYPAETFGVWDDSQEPSLD